MDHSNIYVKEDVLRLMHLYYGFMAFKVDHNMQCPGVQSKQILLQYSYKLYFFKILVQYLDNWGFVNNFFEETSNLKKKLD